MMQIAKPRVDGTAIPATILVHYSELAYRALLAEVNLTPKPGLVDRYNCGAHKDMALEDFYSSARSIHPYFPRFIQLGASSALLPEGEILSLLRPLGMECESAMFRATAGVNTHKGSIFSLGLLCAAIGRLSQQQRVITAESLCQTVSIFCHGLTERELRHNNNQQTAGQRLFQQSGLTGARGEAEAGYPLVINLALPHYRACLSQGVDPELALLDTLVVLMANNSDTNVASRGGMAGLSWLQQYARTVLRHGGIRKPHSLHLLHDFDQACIARNLSPGGSADLLIVTWFLAQISQSNP